MNEWMKDTNETQLVINDNHLWVKADGKKRRDSYESGKRKNRRGKHLSMRFCSFVLNKHSIPLANRKENVSESECDSGVHEMLEWGLNTTYIILTTFEC